MKKLLLAAGVSIVSIAVVTASVNHYNTNQTNKTQEAQAVANAQAVAVDAAVKAEQTKAAAQEALLVKKANAIRVECEKGMAAYETLSSYAKTTVDKPSCGTVTIK